MLNTYVILLTLRLAFVHADSTIEHCTQQKCSDKDGESVSLLQTSVQTKLTQAALSRMEEEMALPPPDTEPNLSGRGSVPGHPDFDHLDYAYNHKFGKVDTDDYLPEAFVDTDDSGSTHPDEFQKANGAGGSDAEVYGEILPESVLTMLREANASEGMRFYDLGSGAGKITMIAWLLGMKATGVELSPSRYNHSCQALARLQAIDHRPSTASDRLEFTHGSFLETDFRDADIIFTDSVMWTDDMMEQLAEIASGLKPGAKILSEKAFPNPSDPRAPWFKTLKTLNLQASWSDSNVNLQERLPHTSDSPSSATLINVNADHHTDEHCSL